MGFLQVLELWFGRKHLLQCIGTPIQVEAWPLLGSSAPLLRTFFGLLGIFLTDGGLIGLAPAAPNTFH